MRLNICQGLLKSKHICLNRWQHGATFATGQTGGPLVIFDNSSNAMVISPMSQFMAASNQLSLDRQELSYGIMGLVDAVPANYSIEILVYYSDKGINQVIRYSLYKLSCRITIPLGLFKAYYTLFISIYSLCNISHHFGFG